MESLETLFRREEEYRKLGLDLDMTRGKPCPEQLKLSEPMASLPIPFDAKTEEGTDLRNYGNPFGLLETKRLMGSLVGVDPENVIVLGNSSLAAMFSVIEHGFMKGFSGCAPWKEQKGLKWLCPVPGYDRHFKVTQYFGFEMINIPMDENGPDMDMVERLVSTDPSIKGIWCVPKFSNPCGYVYSSETVHRFAKLKPAAKDFRIFWDNAYVIHDLEAPFHELPELLSLCVKEGNPDMVIEYLSTSKITFPGSGIAAVLSSPANLSAITESLKIETIGFDKVNQMRHYLFLKDKEGVLAHMKKHAEILRPKFELVERVLAEELSGVATWTHPRGGYFVALTVNHCAAEALDRCTKLGVRFTPVGAAFPYGKDPDNSTIRIAPTYPSLEELEVALRVLCTAVKIESISKD